MEPARLEGHRKGHRYWPQRLTRLARQSNGGRLTPELVEKDWAENATQRQRPLRCAHCGHAITHRDEAITVSGGHEHTFVNPAGILFTVRLFCHAPGCRFQGSPSAEFSWFPGYLWRLAFCGGCDQHLGWLFQGAGDEFSALIAAAIREDE